MRVHHLNVLNALVDMQQSPAYAVRKSILHDAEQAICTLEREAETAERELAAMREELQISDEAQLTEIIRLRGLLAEREAASSGGNSNCADMPEATASPHDTALRAEVERLRRDGERMDWLESQYVEVRTPLVYGSRANFVTSAESNDGEEIHNRIRELIDATMGKERSLP